MTSDTEQRAGIAENNPACTAAQLAPARRGRGHVERHVAKHRLIVIAAMAVLALPVSTCAVPTRSPLEALLNLTWLLLVIGVFANWVWRSGNRGCVRATELLSLVFVLALLFPIFSTSDDQARLDVANDASTSQSVITTLKAEKQTSPSLSLGKSPMPASVVAFRPLACSRDEVVLAPTVLPTAPANHETGNHSPPFC